MKFSREKRYKVIPNLRTVVALDDFEEYAVSSSVDGLMAGIGWSLVPLKRHRRFELGAGQENRDTPYVDHLLYLGIGTTDNMESYAVSSSINGFNGGTPYYIFWGSSYVTRDLGVIDDMESYSISSSLNGLNGGSPTTPFWSSSYVDR